MRDVDEVSEMRNESNSGWRHMLLPSAIATETITC